MPKTLYKLIPQNFELFSGNHKTLMFTHRDKDGAAINITGATIAWALATSEKSKSNIIDYSTADQVVITDAANGKYEVRILGAATEPLTPRDYYHEVRITDASGRVSTSAYGIVEVKRNIIAT